MKDKVTIHTLKKLKTAGQKICMVTAYDATFANWSGSRATTTWIRATGSAARSASSLPLKCRAPRSWSCRLRSPFA